MEKKQFDFVAIYYEPEDNQYLPLFEEACQKSIPLIRYLTGLPDPEKCSLYILRSWRKFIFHSVSIPEKIIYALTYPLWQHRYVKTWPLIGGVALYGKTGFGVKSPPLFAASDRSLGEKIFISDENLERKVKGAISHEFTHVYCDKLKLPVWLNEGIALLINDCFTGWQTIKPETIQFMQQYEHKENMLTYKNLMSKTLDDTAYQYIRGYWIVRYILLKDPEKLRNLLQVKRSEDEILDQLAEWFEIPKSNFWKTIDNVLQNTFLDGMPAQEYPACYLTEF